LPDFNPAPGSLPDPRRGRDLAFRLDHFRPYLRVEISASIVPGDVTDTNRWYRFVAGLPLAGESWEGASGQLIYLDSTGKRQSMSASNAISSITGQDNFGGQGCSISFLRTALGDGLAELARPMDRLRVEVKHPWAPGNHRWTLFDGLLRDIRTTATAGGGYSSRLALNAGGLQMLLQNAVFNWQGALAPNSDLLTTASGKTLFEKLGRVALPPHLIIRAFVESMLSTTMGIKIGDIDNEAGISLINASASGYFKFGTGSQFASLPSLSNPLPWVHVAGQSGQSFWNLFQRMCEPFLHELFVGYRPYPDCEVEVPVLIHRPRPFPGLPEFDGNWTLGPEMVVIGGHGKPTYMSSTDSRSLARHPNCFHWAGGGLGDASTEIFLSKVAWGWQVSDALVNRYGYAPVGLSTMVAPLDPSVVANWSAFCKKILQHYATQEAPLSLMPTRNLGGVFLPVRPGQILVDQSWGPGSSDTLTGYVTGTTFDAQVDGDSCSLNCSVDVERVIRGVDGMGYPAAARALVPDLKRVNYAGDGVGDLGPVPAVNSSYLPPQPLPPTPQTVTDPLAKNIKAAAASQGIPAWVLAHVCQQESSMARDPAAQTNICQVKSAAVADLQRVNYQNPDGSTFSAADLPDQKKNLFAAAKYLSMCKGYVTSAGCPAAAPTVWIWTLAAYTNGPTTTRTYGAGIGWVPPDSYIGAVSQNVYQRYYSQAAIKNGQANFGWMG